MASEPIRFNRANEKPYGCFSNLYRCGVYYEGIIFSTAEHAYQYGKPSKKQVRQWLMDAPSPALLAMAAHGLYSWDIVPGWSKCRYERMRQVVLAKFTQNTELAAILLSTGDAEIIECPTTDSDVNRRWGQVNGVGHNWLGKILMETRSKLREVEALDQERTSE